MSTHDAVGLPDRADLIQLGHELDTHGFRGQGFAIRAIVRAARAHGVADVAAGVLADLTAPEVARLRAFAVVSAALAKLDGSDRGAARVA